MEYNLTDFYIFKNCEKKLLDEIAENMQIRHAISGEIIFSQGDIPKNLYIVSIVTENKRVEIKVYPKNGKAKV